MPIITPRTVPVLIYHGDDLARMRALLQATVAEESKTPQRVGDATPDAVQAAATEYDEFVTEAAERAVEVVLEQVGRKRWRQVRDQCPARADNEIDQILGYDRDALAEILVPESLVAPVMAAVERDKFLDSLSEADWERLTKAVVAVNTEEVADPKDGASLVSMLARASDESSKPPARLA